MTRAAPIEARRGSEPAPARGLILASRSPQRRAILTQLQIPFLALPADVEELEEGPPEQIAIENARRKAAAVAGDHPDALVLGVDTVVCLGDRIYGKPRDAEEARATLQALAGRRHLVLSGICLVEKDRARSSAVGTWVEFRALDRRLVDWYVESEEWRDRAGGYAIQGRGAALVARLDGDYLNVVGLPVAALLDLEPELLHPRG
jgi:septum formation protein